MCDLKKFLVVILLTFSCVLSTCESASAQGRKFNYTPVQLKSEAKGPLVGRFVHVLKYDDETEEYKTVSRKNKFEKDGTCVLDLQSGKYTFEVFDASKNPLCCMKLEVQLRLLKCLEWKCPLSLRTKENQLSFRE